VQVPPHFPALVLHVPGLQPALPVRERVCLCMPECGGVGVRAEERQGNIKQQRMVCHIEREGCRGKGPTSLALSFAQTQSAFFVVRKAPAVSTINAKKCYYVTLLNHSCNTLVTPLLNPPLDSCIMNSLPLAITKCIINTSKHVQVYAVVPRRPPASTEGKTRTI
jgi:hypothetical protein